VKSDPTPCQILQLDEINRPGKITDAEQEIYSMLEKFDPAAAHDRLWPSLLVIGLIGLVGIALMEVVRL
jgi:hypothetical protein